MKTKTVREWFAELPADIEARAIANTEKCQSPSVLNLNDSSGSMEMAIRSSFDWDKTPEGYCFWLDVCQGNYGEMGAPKPAESDTWYVCFNPYRNEAPKFRHETFEEAQAEAIRLAEKEGKKIHVLKLMGTAQVNVEWKERS